MFLIRTFKGFFRLNLLTFKGYYTHLITDFLMATYDIQYDSIDEKIIIVLVWFWNRFICVYVFVGEWNVIFIYLIYF